MPRATSCCPNPLGYGPEALSFLFYHSFMAFIREITTENPQAAFESDVALAWYPGHPNNARLAGSYSWTRQQIGDEMPSLSALNRLREGFESDEIAKLGNRHLWEAIYGHGKSHLALALANFFGKPAGSPEVEAVLAAVKHAQGDHQGLRSFKESRPPYLVLCLFGNSSSTLAQGVVRGLEKALAAHPDTKNADLGLWFQPAQASLAALAAKPTDDAKAAAFLQTLDPPLALQDLRDDLDSRRGQYREQLSQMLHHVNGYAPAFGDMLGPKEVVASVAERFCGENKPFAGLLILFDEFGRFAHDYASQYNLLSKNQPLQNLLEGIRDLQSRAAIVAFTQASPEGITERVMSNNLTGLKYLHHELTRFPDPLRKVLVSPLEAVLGDFLQQDLNSWNALLDANPAAEAGLDAAVDMTKVLFPARYQGWTPKQVQDQLGRECFPLHPLTTALLCTLGVRETVSARPSLGFVQEAYRRFADLPALTADGGLQFIHPIHLVAVFKESLAKSDESWSRYQNALRLADADLPQLRPADPAHLKADVLAAMFVRETVPLTVGTGLTDHESIIAALCGHPRAAVGQALRELAADGRIQHDPAGKKYLFWSFSQDGMKANRTLATETDRLVNDPVDFKQALSEQLTSLDYAEEVALGNAIDWAAPVCVVPRVLWSREYLKGIIRRFQLNAQGNWLDTSVCHGYAIRPVGHTDEEVAWLRTHASADFEAVLQELDADYPPPAVLLLPQHSHAGLLRALAQQHVLDGWGSQTRADLGDKAIEQIQAQTKEQLQVEVGKLRDEEKKVADYRVPSVYAPAVNAVLATNPTPSLSTLLKTCYQPAYGWRAPYLDDAVSSTSYRKGVWTACNYLRRDKFSDWQDNTLGSGGAPARRVFDRVLRDTPSTWGVVDHGLRVVAPRLDVVQRGWQVLEEAVPEGTGPDERVSLREPLLKLLNAPYGYDYYALGLLFCAWVGRHRRTLHFFRGATGPRLTSADWFTSETNFEKVISLLLGQFDLYAAREDQGAVKQRIELVLREWQDHQSLAFTEAESRLAELQEYADNEAGDPELRELARETLPQLTVALQQIRDYHAHLTQTAEELPALTNAHPDTIKAAVKLLDTIRKGPPQVSVLPVDPTQAAQVEAQTLNTLRTLVAQTCNIYTDSRQTNSLNKCNENETRLRTIVGYLGGLTTELSLSKVEDALATIQQEKQRLAGEEQDAGYLVRLREIDKLRNLVELRAALTEMQQRAAHSEKGQALRQTTLDKVQSEVIQLEQGLANALAKANELPDRDGKTTKDLIKEVKALSEWLLKKHDHYVNAEPEAAQHAEALKWCDIWTKIIGDVNSWSDESLENTAALQKHLKKYDALTILDGCTEAHQAFVLQARQAVEARFADQVQAAVEKLTHLTARTEQKDPAEPAAQLFQDLQTAIDSVFHFLPKEEKPRLDRLKKALQKRIDADQVEDIAHRFGLITDPVQRARCVERLSLMLE